MSTQRDPNPHITVRKYCWDGWLATVKGIPLIRAKASTASEAVESVLKQLEEHGANAEGSKKCSSRMN